MSLELSSSFDRIERTTKDMALSPETNPMLISILRTSLDICSIDGMALATILNVIPFPYPTDAPFPPERKMSLVDGFQKLGHYIVASRRLLHLARKVRAFQKVVVRDVNVRKTDSRNFIYAAPGMSQKGLLDQYLDSGQRSLEHTQTVKRLGARFREPLLQLQRDVKHQARQRKRIHAEIQLVFYYEQQQRAYPKPRVICSTKNACYLCNLFLRLHGEFFTPKTHGKLYPRWLLPNPQTLRIPERRVRELRTLYQRFSRHFEREVLDNLSEKVMLRGFDNESRLFNLSSQTASEVTLVNTVADTSDDKNGDLSLIAAVTGIAFIASIAFIDLIAFIDPR